MSADNFARTEQTASEADAIAAMLTRLAKGIHAHGDTGRLTALADRYRDYAAALRETIGHTTAEPDEQEAIL
jgi:hypothetical protein